jgi:threonine dehydratase
VALAARTAARSRQLSISTSVILPATSAPSKIAGARHNGAKVVLAGIDPQDRELAAAQILKHTGATLIGPMDNPLIVNGQGTATLELLDQVQEFGSKLDAVVLPSATGGLLAGAGIVCQNSETLVFGCEPSEGGPDLRHSVASGILPDPKSQFSIADGLRASTSKGNFNLIRQHVNGIYTATEPEIKHVWRMLIEEMRLMIEPSSAVSVATVMFNQGFRKKLAAQKRDWNIGIILTGGNTTVTRIIEEFGDSQESFKHANEPLQIAAM